ncbi:Rib/alpha-like domain-containing protein [Enterococcus faecium]|uniref:Rib/alpha-like domain-containing protein n=1 Tax=Enterococcus faecium TaxID=1352 RepID=UPI0010C1FD25|nr:Rib/alpha-like domain-containing protein [Enterococcus faecium]TKM99771.1 YSIRK-type signal peptide-containing protein [Enterococcus faecium]
MVSKNNKRVFLEKTKKRVLKYSIKKLSVGVASVLVGVGLIFGATEAVNAQGNFSSSKILATATKMLQVGDKEASGNTFQENPGYSKNYNFSDLQFNPSELTGDVLKGNTINFEVYGKHNIAASTDNWEIRLQLDERLAKYVENIKVDSKKVAGISYRRTFVRINDSLGRPTNIWKVNYIRASDGLFAGAETTDTQTAPNGVITFEKNIDEIFKEIGADNLKSDRLMYRIYLVSHQDNDKIVPGIESTGYFITDQDSLYNKLDVSENNSDQFKHGSVNTTYEEPNIQTKDGSGSTGDNGAIILDHKLTKEKNFSYTASAKGTPWYANYKIDERLVPYVAGIQMHMVQADKVTYDVSFESGKKVADLAIERRKDHENYGVGSITDNDLTKLIDFANASPRPVVVRYVLQLTKPLDEILAEMKTAAQVEGNKPFGEDFIFDSWLSDNNNKLIQNTYGTGYYYLQDIDGDGNPDDKEESGDTNPYIGKPELEEVYDVDTTVKGKVFIHELAGTGHKAQLVDKEGNVLAEKDIAPNEKDGAPVSGTVDFEFTGVDSSKLIAKDELKVQIVSTGFDKAEEGSTIIKESPKAIDKQTVVVGFKPDAKESIRNNQSLPDNATYSWKTEPDTSKATDNTKGVVTVTIGNRTFDVTVEFAVEASQAMENNATYDAIETQPETTVQSGKPKFDKDDVRLSNNPFAIDDTFDETQGKVTIDSATGKVTFTPEKGIGEDKPTKVTIPVSVTYEDGSSDEVEVDVTVTDNRSDADKYEPTVEGEKVEVGGTVDLTDNVTNLPTLPEGTTVTDVTPGGTIDTNTPGNYEGVIEVTYPDGTKDTVKVPVEVTDNRSDADKYEPTVEGEKVEIGGTVDLTDNVTNSPTLPEGTTVTDVTPGGTIDTNTPGNYEGVIEVTYPDGTKDTVKVPVEVTDNRSNADKYNPEGQKVTTDLNKEPDASEGIKNKEDLPKGTTYAWKEKVDVSTAGNKKGTIVVTYPDGSSDEVEVDVTVTDTRSDADKYNPEGQKVTTDLNKEPDASEGIKNKEDLPKGTTYAWKEKVDVSTAGNKKGTIVVTYPDGSSDEVEVDVTVTDTRSDADKYNPEGQKVTTDLNKEPDASEGIKNKEDLPKGTTYTWKEKVDVSTAGNKKGTVVVTYPDGSKEEVEVTISVVDKKAPNKPQVDPITEGDQIVTGKTEPNAEVTVTLPDGSQYHGTADENGNFTVKVPKLEAGTKVIVTATDESGNTSEPTDVVVSSNTKDSGKNDNKGKTDNQGSNSNQDKNRGKSQSSKVFPKTGEIDSNIFTISGGLILLGTLGLLGYKNRKKENE